MFKKIVWIGGIAGATVCSYLGMAVIFPVIRQCTGYAANNTSNVTYHWTYVALTSAPLWLWFIPAIVGLVAMVIVWRQPE